MSNETTHLIAAKTGARQAYEEYDVTASRTYHDGKSKMEEQHQTEGEYMKAVIFGGLDGILTSFAIVAGAAGDALSMGVGEFLSSKAHNEWVLSERKRELWEMENYPEGEIEEMIDIYEGRGMDRNDARLCVQTMAKYKEFFVDVMMTEELLLQVPSDDHVRESLKEGCVMFFSFAIFGSFPLLGYVFFPMLFPQVLETEEILFSCACAVTGIVLFVLGAAKSMFSASHWFASGMETLLLGGACASVAYNIGQVVDGVVQR